MKEFFGKILRFLRFDKKCDSFQRLKTGKFALFGCVQEIHRELYFMLNTWSFHHCGWTPFSPANVDMHLGSWWRQIPANMGRNRLTVNKEVKYVINGFRYVGRD